MSDFKPDDWVRIDTGLDENIDGLTGTVEREHADWVRCGDTIFTIRLDKPLDDGTGSIDVWGSELQLLQSRDVIAVVTAADGACVAAVHDPASRHVDVVCSEHADFLTFIYDRGTADAARDSFRADAATYAEKHAASKHTNDSVDRG